MSLPGDQRGTLTLELIAQLASLAGDALLTSPADLAAYAWDNTDRPFSPQAVVLAQNADQVARVLLWCHRHRIPVTPRGAGTGNVGGALPVQGGILLSTQRMNRLLSLNSEDRYVVVEPGVVNADLQARIKPRGLFWPPDPSSSRSCTIGGNLAMCSAGPNAVRYGVTRDWVLGLRAVLPNGQSFATGGRTTKGVVGYDLTRLLVGSEGTLAVITEATLKLAPLPESRRLLRALFATTTDAAQAVTILMQTSTPPCAIEFLDGASLNLLRQHGHEELPADGRALLLVEWCGTTPEVTHQVQTALPALTSCRPLALHHAESPAEMASLWQIRHALSPTLRQLAPKRTNEDVVVPVSRLPELIAQLEELARLTGIPIVTFGHAGNGNLHVNLLTHESDQRLRPALEQLFRLVLSLDGSLSGEHGVGIQKQSYLPWEIDPIALALQQGIKSLFDPQGLLNPGKLFPPQGSMAATMPR